MPSSTAAEYRALTAKLYTVVGTDGIIGRNGTRAWRKLNPTAIPSLYRSNLPGAAARIASGSSFPQIGYLQSERQGTFVLRLCVIFLQCRRPPQPFVLQTASGPASCTAPRCGLRCGQTRCFTFALTTLDARTSVTATSATSSTTSPAGDHLAWGLRRPRSRSLPYRHASVRLLFGDSRLWHPRTLRPLPVRPPIFL